MKHLLYSGLLLFCCAQLTEAQAQKTATSRPSLPQADVKAILCGATPDSTSKGTLYYTLSKAEFGAMDSLCLQSEDPTLHISKYHLIYMPKAGYMEEVSITGNAFGKVAKRWIAGAAPGNMFVFDYLKATDARGYEKRLQNIAVTIR